MTDIRRVMIKGNGLGSSTEIFDITTWDGERELTVDDLLTDVVRVEFYKLEAGARMMVKLTRSGKQTNPDAPVEHEEDATVRALEVCGFTFESVPEFIASEAVFGFVSWLTTRAESVTFGAGHDSAPAAELVQRFLEANRLAEPRPGWEQALQHPQETASEGLPG